MADNWFVRPPLSRYDNPYVPNLVERHYNPGLALAEDLEQAYARLSGLLEQALVEARRVPEHISPDQIERTEDEVAAISSLQRIGEWLSEEQVAVFERDPAATAEHFARWGQGWSQRIGVDSPDPRPEIGQSARMHGLEARCVDREDVFVGQVFYFELTPQAEQRVQAMIAAAHSAADQLSTPSGQQAMRALLSAFEDCSAKARSALEILEAAALDRCRLSDQEV